MNWSRWNGWIVAGLVLIVAAAGGGFAYNIGLSQGLAQVGAAAGSPPPYAYGWHRPWGFGFLFPLLFLWFFCFAAVRGLWWRPWGHWSSYGHYGPPPHVRDRFDEWHRQAHERMKGTSDS